MTLQRAEIGGPRAGPNKSLTQGYFNRVADLAAGRGLSGEATGPYLSERRFEPYAAEAAHRLENRQAAGGVGYELQRVANLIRCQLIGHRSRVFSSAWRWLDFSGGENEKPGSQRGLRAPYPTLHFAGFITCLLKKRLRDDDRSKRRL